MSSWSDFFKRQLDRGSWYKYYTSNKELRKEVELQVVLVEKQIQDLECSKFNSATIKAEEIVLENLRGRLSVYKELERGLK